MPKIFHGPCKNPPTPSYILNVVLKYKSFDDEKLDQTF